MLFVVTCWDRPAHLQTRLDVRASHLAYLDKVKEQLKLAGPFLGADGKTAIGSLFIYEAADPAGATTLVEGDPFFKADLFASVEIKPWRQGGGKSLD
jgi:uncharacterized protein YciI